MASISLKLKDCFHVPWLQFFSLILLSFQHTFAYIQVPVEQGSYLMPYNSTYSDMHAFFDVSYADQGDLIQADDNNTYYFSKIGKLLNSFFLAQNSIGTY